MLNFLSRLFDDNAKEIKKLQKSVAEINSFEEKIKKLSDKQLAAKTAEFKEKIANNTNPRDLLPEAFAVVREAAVRTIGQRHFDVQMMAAICLYEGKIAEQKTGEGKTLSAVPALYLRALEGKGTHLVTVNDYLARIGCGWMGPIFHFLGLTVGCIIPYKSFLYDPAYKTEEDDERLTHLKPVERKLTYEADVTYGVNNEFGFDYLRDNMTQSLTDSAQRKHFFAIVDEVDFALIDEARTPLIISSPYDEPIEKYYKFAKLAAQILPETDYIIDEKAKTAMLTELGIRKVERALGVNNLYEEDFETIHQIENALKAKTVYIKNRDYVVKNNQVIIVDEFTGRLMEGRRWSDGLHQAIEAKEGAAIQKESKTWATVTFQNYFRMYQTLSGMTGTAATEAEEFKKIYGLDVIVLPTNKKIVREDYADVIYKTQRAKYAAVVAEIEENYKSGRPVLVGTTSIEKNEMMGAYLKRKGIPHQILNAKLHEQEAKIISQAGRLKAVTIATNMAGRGVDIILGGEQPKKVNSEKGAVSSQYKEWEKEHRKVIELGGLYVIGTERHEARRIDNQLRGRGGRQGDPGASKFFISLEDDLMRIFGGEQISSLMTKFKMPEEMPISHSIVNKMIQQIQVKIEGFNFDIRKSVVEFDDIVNKQREIIYKTRRQVLEDAVNAPEKLKKEIFQRVLGELELLVNSFVDLADGKVDARKLSLGFAEIVAVDEGEEIKKLEKNLAGLDKNEALKKLTDLIIKFYKNREELIGLANCRDLEKSLFLHTADQLWVDHLTALENLRESVRLRGYGQKDPLIEFRKEGYEAFQQLLAKINYHLVRRLFRMEIQLSPQFPQSNLVEKRGALNFPENVSENAEDNRAPIKEVVSGQTKVGRNDPCPCGAKRPDGTPKKYKHCCYPKYG